MQAFTKNERRYLSKRACLLCDQPLHSFMCSAIWREPCSKPFLEERARRALEGYKQRASR